MPVARVNASLFASSVFVNIKQFNHALRDLYKAGSPRDEGFALVVQIWLMTRCNAFFGSFSSNIAIIASDLMDTPVHDVDGRPYCGCGASFCMNSKNVHW